MLAVFESGTLNCFTFFHLIPLTLSVFRNPILTYFSFFVSLDSLLCVLNAFTPGLAFSLVMPLSQKVGLVFAEYLSFHFSVSQPKVLRSRSYLSDLRRATCPDESHSSFCSPFSPDEFLVAAANLSSSTDIGPDKIAYPMLKHHLRFGMDFLLYIFTLSWTLPSFLSIWKTSSIIPIYKMGKSHDSPAFYQSISFTCCVSKLFERIILFRQLFFLKSNSILSPRQAGFQPGRSNLDQNLYLSQMGLTNPGQALGRSSLLLISSKLLTLSGIPPFSIISFRLASLFALLVGYSLSFLMDPLLKSQKSFLSSPSRCSARIRLWP